MIYSLALFILAALIYFKFKSKPSEVLIITVIDGDTVIGNDNNGRKYRIRLLDIDAPELSQKYGQLSKDYLKTLILNKWVRIRFKGKDIYGRHLAYLYVDNKNVSGLMVKNGMAFSLKLFSVNQILARITRKGMWIYFFPAKPCNAKSRKKNYRA